MFVAPRDWWLLVLVPAVVWQWVFDAKPFLTKWWLRVGYHLLTMLFVLFVGVYGWGMLG